MRLQLREDSGGEQPGECRPALRFAGNSPHSPRGYSLIEILIVVSISSVIAAIAIPMMGNTLGNFRLDGDARSLTNAVSLAKLRAASSFTKTRLYVDLSVNAFHIETWNKTTAAWTSEGATTYLASSSEIFSSGVVASPPANTQAAVGMTQCLNAAGTAIGSTACVVFNSRGIPIVDASAGGNAGPTANQALYLTDGTAVFGVTNSATGVIRLWRTQPAVTPTWVAQ